MKSKTCDEKYEYPNPCPKKEKKATKLTVKKSAKETPKKKAIKKIQLKNKEFV